MIRATLNAAAEVVAIALFTSTLVLVVALIARAI